MGAYVVLAGIGLFDMEGGCTARPAYQISGPAFRRVVIHRMEGDVEIIAHNNSRTNVYIQSANWNGKPLPTFSLPHDELQKGGRLTLEMGASPAMGASEMHPGKE